MMSTFAGADSYRLGLFMTLYCRRRPLLPLLDPFTQGSSGPTPATSTFAGTAWARDTRRFWNTLRLGFALAPDGTQHDPGQRDFA
jgi:hypothetical protein